MKRKTPRPNYWMLYLVLPIFVLLAWIVTRLALTGLALQIVQIGAILLVFFLTNRWISDNEGYFAAAEPEEVDFPDVPEKELETQRSKVKLKRPLPRLIGQSILAGLIVIAATLLFALIGSHLLGEGVIALLYLAPIAWTTVRWGQIPGVSAALAAALCFDFYFIPPYRTFQVGSLEGWLMLILFAVVSVALIGRVVKFYENAGRKERDAAFLFELVALIESMVDRDDIAQLLAERVREHYEAAFTKVILYQRGGKPSVLKVRAAEGVKPYKLLPGRTLAIRSGMELTGEISIAQAGIPLPGDDDPLLQSICRLAAIAVDRAQTTGYSGWSGARTLRNEQQA